LKILNYIIKKKFWYRVFFGFIKNYIKNLFKKNNLFIEIVYMFYFYIQLWYRSSALLEYNNIIKKYNDLKKDNSYKEKTLIFK
jgi:hypothetical protein